MGNSSARIHSLIRSRGSWVRAHQSTKPGHTRSLWYVWLLARGKLKEGTDTAGRLAEAGKWLKRAVTLDGTRQEPYAMLAERYVRCCVSPICAGGPLFRWSHVRDPR